MNGDITIRICDEKALPQAKKLWSECFGDEIEYVDFIYCESGKNIVIMSAFENERLVGLSHIFPTEIITESKAVKAFYGYAICVAKDKRGQGIFDMLHRYAVSYAQENGGMYFLKPANRKLCEYYKSFGLEEINYFAYENSENNPAETTGCINWGNVLSDVSEKEIAMTGGKCGEINCSGSVLRFTAAEVDDTLVVTSRCDTAQQKHIENYLSQFLSGRTLLFQHTTPCEKMDGGVILACNCPKNVDFSAVHFNLIFV